MATNLKEFIDYLNAQIGQPYIWGGQHTVLTPDNYKTVITRREKDPDNQLAVERYCENAFENGETVLYGYDCSGLGMYWLQNVKGVFAHDMSANSMMGVCEQTDELKAGYWVFRVKDGKATHIGYMVTDNEVIHAAGRKLGVVRVRYKASYWNRIGKPNCIDFTPTPSTHKYVRVKGIIKKDGTPQKRVYVRSGNGTAFPAIGVARSADTFPCYGQADADPHWYMIGYKGKRAYITCNERYTEIVYGVGKE